MAGASQVRAGSAFVEILAKDGGLRKGLDNASKTLKQWGEGINALGQTFLKIGTAAIAPLVATSKVFAEMGDHLAKASTRTGVAVEELSGLAYAAEQSGSDLEGLENGLRKMQKTLAEAAQGSQGARDALANLGLSVEDLKSLKPDEQFKRIADRMSQVKDPATRAALAMEIFGKQGTSLIPLMADGAAGIDQLIDDAKRLGLVWSTEDAKAAEEFGDRLDDLWKVVKKGTADIGGALVPILREVAVVVTDNVVKVNAWIRAHRETVQLALKVAAGVVAAGAAFVALGTAITYIGSVVGGVSTAIGAVAGGFGTVAKILSTVLFSGVGLVVAALAGLAAYLLYNSEVGQRALGAIGGYFQALGKTVSETMGGVMDAMRAGDFSLAARVMWLGIKAAFLEGIEPLRTAWADFRKFFIDVGNSAWFGIQAGWEEVRNLLTVGWTNTVAALQGIWDAFTTTIADGIDRAKNAAIDLAKSAGGALGTVANVADDRAARESKSAADAAARDKALTDAAVAREKKRNAALEEEAKRTAEAKARIGAAANAGFDDSRAGRDAAVARAKAEREAAEAQLKAAAEAAKNRAGQGGGDNTPTAPKFNPDDVAQGLDDLAKRTISVQGTFNSAALNALGAGSIPQQQLQELKQINRNTKNTGGFRPAFS